jgi:hypothetical protein
MEALVSDLLKELKEQRMHSDKLLKEQKNQHDAQMEALMKLLDAKAGTPKSDVTLMSEISQRVPMFVNDSDIENAFSVWYERHKDVFVVDAKSLDAKCRVRLLLDKLDAESFQKFKRHRLPEEPYTDKYDETVAALKELFDKSLSIFTHRYQLLRHDKDVNIDFLTYMGEINESCERTKLADATADELKSLLFVFGLKNQQYADVRKRLIMFLDKKHRAREMIMLKDVYAECEAYLSTVKDSNIIGNDGFKSDGMHSSNVMAVAKAKIECYNCLGPHVKANCQERLWKCRNCGCDGHREKYCRRRRDADANVVISRVTTSVDEVDDDSVPSVRMPVDVNGMPISFVVDTGSEVTCISESDWCKLGSPTLKSCRTRAVDIMGRPVKFSGEFVCDFMLDGVVHSGTARVTKDCSLLGMNWMVRCESMRDALSSLIQSDIEKFVFKNRSNAAGKHVMPKIRFMKCCRRRTNGAKCSEVDRLSVKDHGSLYPDSEVYGSRNGGSATVSDEPWFNVCNRLAVPSSSRIHGVQSKTSSSHSLLIVASPNPHP